VGPGEIIWTGAENVAPNGIRSPEHPARRESIDRLSYPCPTDFDCTFHNQLEATTETSMLYLYYLMHACTHIHTRHVKFCLAVHLSLHKFQIRDLLVFDSIETGLLPKSITEKRALFESV
jgi:hypothetical protein